MGYIGNEPTTGHFPVDNFTSSGGSTYTLAKAPASVGAIEVSVQGVLQSTTAYTVSGTTLTIAGVASGDKIFVRHLGETLVLPTPADGTVTTAKIADGTVTSAKITSLDATKLTGSIADARVPASAVTQHVDLTSVRQDIAMLAIYNSVSDNRAAYNLPSSFIDTFQDDTGLTTQTNVDRVATGEYVASVYSSVTPHTAFDYAGSSETYTWHGTTASQINLANIYNLNPTDVTAYWASPSTGYATGLTVDYLTTLSNISKIGVSKANYYGCARQFRIRYSSDNSNWTVLNLTGATTSQLGNQPDTITFVDRANGVADFNQTGSGVVHGGGLLTGWSPFDARYLRFELGTWQALANSSTGFSSFIPYYDVGSAVANATGTLISDTQTASSATTKMSGVILYKDNAGTATLGTDLVISLSANGGTNYTEAASYGAVTPLFSTGVKMVRLGETTVTSGTTPVIKAVWANQASGSKETQLHGWAMNY